MGVDPAIKVVTIFNELRFKKKVKKTNSCFKGQVLWQKHLRR